MRKRTILGISLAGLVGLGVLACLLGGPVLFHIHEPASAADFSGLIVFNPARDRNLECSVETLAESLTDHNCATILSALEGSGESSRPVSVDQIDRICKREAQYPLSKARIYSIQDKEKGASVVFVTYRENHPSGRMPAHVELMRDNRDWRVRSYRPTF